MVEAFGDLNGSGNQQIWIHVHRDSQNIDGNYSTYYGEVRYYGNGYGSWTNNTQYWSANFGGHQFSGNFTIPQGERYWSYKTLWTGWFNHGHDAAGERASWYASASIDTDHSSIGDGSVGVWEPAAPTIPRASTPSFVGGSSLTTGVAVTINMNKLASFTHEVSWSFGNLSNQTAGLSSSSGVVDSVSWTPPHSMLNEIKNSASGNGTVTVTTKNGSTTVGSKTINFTVTANASQIPTVSGITFSDDNSTVVTQVGAFVQGISQLKGVVNSAGIQGSTISASSWTFDGGAAVPSGNSIVPSKGGTVNVAAAAVDSRGRTGTYTGTVPILAYQAPVFNSVLARRANSSNVVQDSGTYLRLDLNAFSQSLMVGSTQKNNLTIKIYTKLYGSNESAWVLRNTITPSGVTYNTAVQIGGGSMYAIDKSYDVKVEIIDKFNTQTARTVVATSEIFMHWGPSGTGYGKYHERGKHDFAGDVFSTGSVNADNSGSFATNLYHRNGALVEPPGVIHEYGGDTAPTGWLLCDGSAVSRTIYAALFAIIGTKFGAGNGSTTFNLPDKRKRVGVGYDSSDSDFNAIGKTGGAKTVSLTAAQNGSHNHAPPDGYFYIETTDGSMRKNSTNSSAGSSGDNGWWKQRIGEGGGGALGTTYSGSGSPHNNMQPFQVFNYIIKT